MINLDLVVANAYKIQPLPETISKLAKIIADENSGIQEVIEVVSFDHALTGNVLRIANSAANRGANQITTVREAVSRIGSGAVLSLAVASNVNHRFEKKSNNGISGKDIWKHSITSAITAEVIAKVSPMLIPPESFTAAMLHDIGKILLDEFLDEKTVDILKRACLEGNCSAFQAETEILGTHHGEIGMLIAQHWELPNAIYNAIGYHHSPDDVSDIICDVVHVSNYITKLITPNDGGFLLEKNIVNPTSMKRIGLKTSDLDKIKQMTEIRLEEVLSQYP